MEHVDFQIKFYVFEQIFYPIFTRSRSQLHSKLIFPPYGGKATHNGTPLDHMVRQKIGGVNIFGGGLALYKEGK